MFMRRFFLVLFFLLNSIILSQTNNDFSVKFTGYVNWSALYDSRKVIAARESHFLLYPKEEKINPEGEDLNNVSNFNMAVIMTRFGAKISAPEFFSAKTSAFIETEFMGNSENDVNGLRLRHAFVTFDWENSSLLLGQTWNPLFIPESFPLQVGSNGGAPFQPFARNPQIRFTQTLENVKLIFALTTQRDYTSLGPLGASSEYLRNEVLPDFHFHFQYLIGKNLFGFGSEYKFLKPATETSKGYVTDNKINGYAIQLYSKLIIENFIFSSQGLYGANLTDVTMLGGYAVKSVDTLTAAEKYTPSRIFSVWADASYGSQFRVGLFSGYTKNLGTDSKNIGKYFSRGSDINNIYRIAPRIEYLEGKIKVSLESEYTNASYGKPDTYGKVKNLKSVGNLRFNTSVFYFF